MYRWLAPIRSFFERERHRSPVRGLLIVLATAVVPVLANAVIAATVPARERPTLAFSASGTIVEAPASAVFWAVANLTAAVSIWLVGAAIAYVVTDRVGGEGRFWRFATLFGWAWLPVLLTGLLHATTVVAAVAVTPPPESLGGVCAYCSRLTDGPLVTLASGTVVLGWLLAALLWVPAIAIGRDVTRRVAAGTAALLVAILLALWATGVLHL